MADIPRSGHDSVPPWWRPASFGTHLDSSAGKSIGAHVCCPRGHVRALPRERIGNDGAVALTCDTCDWRIDDARLNGWRD